jgi:flagellar biosynthesis/type III secretory pathway chaperone
MVENIQTLQDLFDSLESILVNTFRLCESLLEISKRDRQALLEKNLDVLQQITKEKEILVVEMESIDHSRKVIVDQLAKELEIENEPARVSDIITKADESIDITKISRLQQGIITIQADIRELNNGNYTLASLNVQRLEAVQDYIIGLFTAPIYYQPTIKMQSTTDAPTSWGTNRLV